MIAQTVISISRTLIDGAAQSGCKLRAIGGAAILLTCDPTTGDQLFFRRETNDLDFVCEAHHLTRLEQFLTGNGCAIRARHTSANGWLREYTISDERHEVSIHVYSAPLRFSVTIPPPYFTQDAPYTIPLGALFLSKLMRPNSARKVAVLGDLQTLLATHRITLRPTSNDIDLHYLEMALCKGFRGWQRYFWARAMVQEVLGCTDPQGQGVATIHSEAVKFWTYIETAEKSMGWKIANCIGYSFLGAFVRPKNSVEPITSLPAAPTYRV